VTQRKFCQENRCRARQRPQEYVLCVYVWLCSDTSINSETMEILWSGVFVPGEDRLSVGAGLEGGGITVRVVDSMRCAATEFGDPESPTTWTAIKISVVGLQDCGSRGVIEARCAWILLTGLPSGWLGTASGCRRPGWSQGEEERERRAVEEEGY
jgi:hypothetical protein